MVRACVLDSRLLRGAALVRSIAVASLGAVLVSGCGQTGAPLAPSLLLPTPVTDLAASRTADRVTLKWTMPGRTTDRLPLKSAIPVRLCRRVEQAPCQTLSLPAFAPGKPASFEDELPTALTAGGAPQLLTYSVELLTRRGHSAGESNPAYSATGAAPAALAQVAGRASAQGVILQWQPDAGAEAGTRLRLERTLISASNLQKAQDKSPMALVGGGAPVSSQQELAVRLPEGADPGKALDPDASPDQKYRYRLSKLVSVTVDGKPVEIEGPESAELVVDTKDTFPPAPPAGLVAVASPSEGAIDLSWSASLEPDLAGYAVYRQEADGKKGQISPIKPLLASPSFRDSAPEPGHSYTYSVTAIDRDGNESNPSEGANETLPAAQ